MRPKDLHHQASDSHVHATALLSHLSHYGHIDSDDAFDLPSARTYSCYSGILPPTGHFHHHTERLYKIPPGRLFPHHDDDRVMPLAQVAHDQLRAHILGEYYPCVGASAAFHHGTYRFGFYKDLAHEMSVQAHARDLRRFMQEYQDIGDFATFVAVFKYPQSTNEARFEKLLWKHLQSLHEHDGSRWDPHYEPDPQSPHFAFSFEGCAVFVVGMHSGASRYSRRLSFPALIMNPESQIHRLKREGLFDRFAQQVRWRDTRYQGSINPSIPLEPDSEENEARVYSGMPHPPGTVSRCPFHPRPEVVQGHVRIPPEVTPPHYEKDQD